MGFSKVKFATVFISKLINYLLENSLVSFNTNNKKININNRLKEQI